MTAISQPSDVDLACGQVLCEKYTIVKKLGAGGMGAVYLAQNKLGGFVALKLAKIDLANPGARQRFDREAQFGARLRSEHIASTQDTAITEQGWPLIVMDYLEGRDLTAVLAEGPVAVGRAVTLMMQACRGLTVAHERGVVHRDLKPSNLFILMQDGRELLKILDFGIAKQLEAERVALTATDATAAGTLIGTPGYLSPEQALGQTIDQRSDLYSLGAVLYELLSGKKASAGVSPIPGLPAGLNELVSRTLERDPSRRPASAKEFERLLEPYRFATGSAGVGPAGDEGSTTTIEAPLPQAIDDEPDEPVAPTEPDGRTGPPRVAPPSPTATQRRWLVAALAVCALLLVGFVGNRLFTTSPSAERPVAVVQEVLTQTTAVGAPRHVDVNELLGPSMSSTRAPATSSSVPPPVANQQRTLLRGTRAGQSHPPKPPAVAGSTAPPSAQPARDSGEVDVAAQSSASSSISFPVTAPHLPPASPAPAPTGSSRAAARSTPSASTHATRSPLHFMGDSSSRNGGLPYKQ